MTKTNNLLPFISGPSRNQISISSIILKNRIHSISETTFTQFSSLNITVFYNTVQFSPRAPFEINAHINYPVLIISACLSFQCLDVSFWECIRESIRWHKPGGWWKCSEWNRDRAASHLGCQAFYESRLNKMKEEGLNVDYTRRW